MKKSTKLLVYALILQIYLVLWPEMVRAQNRSTTRVKVGVVVDYDRPAGMMGLNCIRMAISEFYSSRRGRDYKTRLVLHSRDSKYGVVEAASSALGLIKNEQVQAIIGPMTSAQANFVVDLGEKANVPIISFTATCPSLTTRSSYFFRATANEASQAQAIASLVKAFGWKQVVPIYTAEAYGKGLIPYLIDTLHESTGARVPYRSVVGPSPSNESLREELRGLMAKQARVFVLHTYVDPGKRILAEAKKIGMMREGFVWIVTNVMTNSLSNTPVDDSMHGVLGLKTYVPRTKEVEGFRDRYRKMGFRDKEVSVFGLWAYDAVEALAMAVEKVWVDTHDDDGKFGFIKSKDATRHNYSNDLNSFGVSQNGPKLRQALSDVRFKGLAGNFSLVHGQLPISTYEIINVVNGDLNNVVGFWTPENGLVRGLNYSYLEKGHSSYHYNTLKDSLGKITWPGGTNEDPKGWEIPSNGTKLKVVVPLRGGFKEFVNVAFNDQDNTTNITGYCIDIFKAVMKTLPYKVDYDFIPFTKNSSHESGGTYDDMVYQVFLGKYDAVVGDVTIRSNRTLYVDFTLPYTESGVSMIVAIKDERNKNAWVFMKPLTWDLWVTTLCFFIFIGFVVWVHEHRINEDFRGPPSHQIGTSFWFSFSTMVFAHREKVVSNYSRFVIIIWAFVLLILTQSYTASLTSRLTAQQLQPTITNISQLIKNKDNVGFLEASFVYEMLKSLGFKEAQLKVYKSPEDLAKEFSNHSAITSQRIVAAFDEKPYTNVFLRKYCSKYTMIDPTFETLGFGFAFPKGSPLVADVSKAILNVTERGTLKEIEEHWFGKKETCPNPSSRVSSNSLGLESFWGLFLITGVSSLFALAIHGVIFFHGHWHEMKSSFPPQASKWDKACVVFRVFDQKDLNPHTSRKTTTINRMSGGFGSSNVVFPIDDAPFDGVGQPVSPTSPSIRSDSDCACRESCQAQNN